MKTVDNLIVGSGIIGLAIARELKKRFPRARILIIDKEDREAFHASGRNSGVLHAGFYYTADSLKAKFTVEGNQAMKAYCRDNGLPVNAAGKLVVTRNDEECAVLDELARRGRANGTELKIVNENEAREIEPNVRTHKKALYSPTTASVDPVLICQTLRRELEENGVEFLFQTSYLGHRQRVIQTSAGEIETSRFINCAGLYADKIANDYGFGRRYTILPFKGLYLKYTKNSTDVMKNIYPVPNIKNPFLGVHFTVTVDGHIKIGPTAIPALWRENYEGLSNFDIGELFQIGWQEIRLLTSNAFGFRDLALEEIKKYRKRYFIDQACQMVQSIDPAGFTEWTRPGIRAQLLDRQTRKLLQDFVVEGDGRSVHVLNAVSPAFTCSLPFAAHVVSSYCS